MGKLNFISEERLNTLVANKKLNNIPSVHKNEKPIFTMLCLTKESPKYKWTAGVSFPAIVKKSTKGLAVYNCVTGRKEIIPATSYKEPSPANETFDYKGHHYGLKDTINGWPRYKGIK